MKQSLVEIFKEIGHFGSDIGCNDKGGQHSYLEVYDKLFEPYRNKSTILEIGLATGDSIKLWDRYFENSTIVGADISVVFNIKDLPMIDNGNTIHIIESDATNPEFLNQIRDYKFNIIIDDGSHVTSDQVDTFNLLRHKMTANGIYIIEDILALDIEREKYISLHPHCEIIDMRHTGRFDNALIIYTKF